jgi:hypothetical protein
VNRLTPLPATPSALRLAADALSDATHHNPQHVFIPKFRFYAYRRGGAGQPGRDRRCLRRAALHGLKEWRAGVRSDRTWCQTSRCSAGRARSISGPGFPSLRRYDGRENRQLEEWLPRTPPPTASAMQYSIRTDSPRLKAPARSPSFGPTRPPGNNARSPIERPPKPVSPRALPILTPAVARFRDSRIFILRVYAHIGSAYKVVRPDILRLPGVPKDGDVSGFPAPCC